MAKQGDIKADTSATSFIRRIPSWSGLLGLLVGAAYYFAFLQGGDAQETIIVEIPQTVVLDPSDSVVAQAQFTVDLVHLGTNRPFNGNGMPGIRLQVESNGTMVEWSLIGYANQTAPSSLQYCSSNSVYFSRYDWAFQSEDGQVSSSGTFSSMPTTVPQRAGPAGDQCLIRLGATGVWRVDVCVDSRKDGPLGLYYDEHGRLHYDGWDRCIPIERMVG